LQFEADSYVQLEFLHVDDVVSWETMLDDDADAGLGLEQ
jgi:hypothetical protein